MIIKGNLDLRRSNVESLGNITKVFGYLLLENCENLKSLSNLKEVKNSLSLNTQIESLGKLEKVGEDLYLQSCRNLKTLGDLKETNRVFLNGSGITREYIIKEKPFLLDKCIW